MSSNSDKATREKGPSESTSEKQMHASSSRSDKSRGEKAHSEMSSKKDRHVSSDTSHKHKHDYEIKPITSVSDIGYVTSPDISSEEEEEEEQKTLKQSSGSNGQQRRDSQTNGQQRRDSVNSQTDGCQRRDSTNSQADDRHLKSSLNRNGDCYEERLKMLVKLESIKEKMSETTYHRKRAAPGEVKKRRAKREFIEGDFSGPCRDKIEYNLEEKPSLRRPEPKPEEPKENKQVKETKPVTQKPKEKRKDHNVNKKEKEDSRKEKHKASNKQDKHKDHRLKEHKDHHKSKKRHVSKHQSSSSSKNLSEKGEDSSSSSSLPTPSFSMAEFMKKKSVWATMFTKKTEPPASEKTEPGADVKDDRADRTKEDATASSGAENEGHEDTDLGSTGTLHQLIGYDKRKYHDEDEDDRKLAGFSQETKSGHHGHRENLEDKRRGKAEQRDLKKMS